jgi:transglutaminase/protease-like cytokinesis protein 3
MSGEMCVHSMFFDNNMSHWAYETYCSKADDNEFACVSLNIHHTTKCFQA